MHHTHLIRTNLCVLQVEEDKPLDLDTRIALLFKDKAGGMAPPFLALGVDSDDETGSSKDKELSNDLLSLPKPLPLPTSLDSDDGKSFSPKTNPTC